ncbi:hypothetical protein GCU67_20965 [Modestobacter muralis]|uniref:Uncharacterized protein n=1 Tax=Modestobacter muralis TaxID=1608614 RepID=A0A6P0F5X7_9ACTN|nr:hypothetical protein [Modestobacter muralis]NEK96618.1 hypothetical protein [Modestobacter muralis]NEN53537.1 hypothetical protein [Modestobacter muralis]
MTLIQIAATLGVGRSSLVRALAQAPDSPAGATEPSVGPAQTALELPEFDDRPDEPSLLPASTMLTDLEVQLLGRTVRRGGEPLEVLTWPAGYSPACPSCAHPTTALEEQYARVAGIRELVIVPLAQPCGCLVDGHVAELHADVPMDAVSANREHQENSRHS